MLQQLITYWLRKATEACLRGEGKGRAQLNRSLAGLQTAWKVQVNAFTEAAKPKKASCVLSNLTTPLLP